MLPPNVIPVGKKNFEYDGGMIRFGAQVQTDAVVDSILIFSITLREKKRNPLVASLVFTFAK